MPEELVKVESVLSFNETKPDVSKKEPTEEPDSNNGFDNIPDLDFDACDYDDEDYDLSLSKPPKKKKVKLKIKKSKKMKKKLSSSASEPGNKFFRIFQSVLAKFTVKGANWNLFIGITYFYL